MTMNAFPFSVFTTKGANCQFIEDLFIAMRALYQRAFGPKD
jgi:hypothetical protein